MKNRKKQRENKRQHYELLENTRYTAIKSDTTANEAVRNCMREVKYNANQVQRASL